MPSKNGEEEKSRSNSPQSRRSRSNSTSPNRRSSSDSPQTERQPRVFPDQPINLPSLLLPAEMAGNLEKSAETFAPSSAAESLDQSQYALYNFFIAQTTKVLCFQSFVHSFRLNHFEIFNFVHRDFIVSIGKSTSRTKIKEICPPAHSANVGALSTPASCLTTPVCGKKQHQRRARVRAKTILKTSSVVERRHALVMVRTVLILRVAISAPANRSFRMAETSRI